MRALKLTALSGLLAAAMAASARNDDSLLTDEQVMTLEDRALFDAKDTFNSCVQEAAFERKIFPTRLEAATNLYGNFGTASGGSGFVFNVVRTDGQVMPDFKENTVKCATRAATVYRSALDFE